MACPTLRFDDIAGTLPFHAALVPINGAGRPAGQPHTHDFHEFALIRKGAAEHCVNGARVAIAAGDITLVRPDDRHVFISTTDDGFELVNVAFPSRQWQRFRALAGIPDDEWDSSLAPRVLPSAGTNVAQMFDDVLHRYAVDPRPVDLVGFLAAVTGQLSSAARPVGPSAPDWLRRACEAMNDEENLRAGVVRLVQLAAVSHGHLTRSMTWHHGTTPVAFVNRLRLERASLLLTTTNEPIGRIAERCGFASQSYFDRRFVEQFTCTPRAYRQRAQRVVAPRDRPV